MLGTGALNDRDRFHEAIHSCDDQSFVVFVRDPKGVGRDLNLAHVAVEIPGDFSRSIRDHTCDRHVAEAALLRLGPAHENRIVAALFDFEFAFGKRDRIGVVFHERIGQFDRNRVEHAQLIALGAKHIGKTVPAVVHVRLPSVCGAWAAKRELPPRIYVPKYARRFARLRQSTCPARCDDPIR